MWSTTASETARNYAGRGLSVEGYLDEQLKGLTQLASITALSKQFDGMPEMTMARVEAIRDFLLVPDG